LIRDRNTERHVEARSPRVSVALTAYNASPFIRSTIDSVLAQTFEDFELIVVDDCSTDDTVQIVESYADPRVRLIRNPTNLGISTTRNIAIGAAQGEYLAALDHDDISLPTRLERQVAFLDSRPEVVLVGTAARLLTNGKIRDYYPPVTEPHLLRWTLLTHCSLIHSSICLRVSVLRKHRLYYRKAYHYAEDFDLYHRFAKVGDLACLPERLTIYREHGGNTGTRHQHTMTEHGQAFMLQVYRELLGPSVTPEDVRRIWTVITRGQPAQSRAEILAVGELLARLLTAFLDRVPLTPDQADDIRNAASHTWWRALRSTARQLGPRALRDFTAVRELTAVSPGSAEVIRSVIIAALKYGLLRS
jgi:GT2 family glycosyltransferase